MRSPTMLRWIWEVPAAIVSAGSRPPLDVVGRADRRVVHGQAGPALATGATSPSRIAGLVVAGRTQARRQALPTPRRAATTLP